MRKLRMLMTRVFIQSDRMYVADVYRVCVVVSLGVIIPTLSYDFVIQKKTIFYMYIAHVNL